MNLTDNTVVTTENCRFVGQIRMGTNIMEGRGTCTWRDGRNYEGEWRDSKLSGHGVCSWPSGSRYEGEWKDNKKSGQGVQTWPNGYRYEGGWKDDERSDRGVLWLPNGRVFDGVWAANRPQQGTAMEPDRDGALLFRATFDGQTPLNADTWSQAERTPAGRIASGGPPPQGAPGGPLPAWEARVELPGGAVLEGTFCRLRPHGLATLTEGGVTYAVEYDGSSTIAENPVPVRKEVRPAAAAARAF